MRTTEPSGRKPAPYTRLPAGVCRAAFVLLACLLGTVAGASPRLFVTIDVESVDGATLPSQIDATCRDGQRCGLMEIARQLEAHSLRGTFFLNVYEAEQWGDALLREITEQLMQRGHEVALHTHPHWAYDPNRPYMYEYSAEDQRRIVREGLVKLQDWTGRPVVAHRAGAYSANPDTLAALSANGITLDSSWFRGYPHSKLGSLGFPDNAPGAALGVVEIPVTVYQRVETPHGLGFLPGVRSIRKLDANWFRDTDETTRVVDAVVAANPPDIVYFLHSFSLMIPDGTDNPAADAHGQANFRAMLERAASHGLVSATFQELHDAGVQPATRSLPVPDVALSVPLANYGAHLLKQRPWVAAAFALLALIAGWLAWRARRARRAPR